MDWLHGTPEQINKQDFMEQQELKEREMPELDTDPHLQLLSDRGLPVVQSTCHAFQSPVAAELCLLRAPAWSSAMRGYLESCKGLYHPDGWFAAA